MLKRILLDLSVGRICSQGAREHQLSSQTENPIISAYRVENNGAPMLEIITATLSNGKDTVTLTTNEGAQVTNNSCSPPKHWLFT